MRLLPQYTAQGKMGVFSYLSVLILKSSPLAVGASQITNRVIVHENRSETKIRRHRIIHPLRTQKKTKDNLTSANPTSKCHMEMTNSMLFLFACNLSRHKNNAPPSVALSLPSYPLLHHRNQRTPPFSLAPTIFLLLPISLGLHI
jgi:hypothetical protein